MEFSNSGSEIIYRKDNILNGEGSAKLRLVIEDNVFGAASASLAILKKSMMTQW